MTDEIIEVPARPGRSCPRLLLGVLAAGLTFTVCLGLNPLMDSLYPVYNKTDFFSGTNRNTDSVAQGQGAHSQTVASEACSVAPKLQPASGGVIGPQGGDATVVQGINTAGTVRVSNLANLEALLHLIAMCAQFLGMSVAILLGLETIQRGAIGKLSKDKTLFLLGGGCVAAFLLPTISSIFIAAARHFNWFC